MGRRNETGPRRAWGGLKRAAWLAMLAGSLVAAEGWASPGVTVIRTPNNGEPGEARTSADGVLHLIYNSQAEGIPYYVRSGNGGASFSAPIPVVDSASRKAGLVFTGAAMAVGKGDAIYAAMMTNNWQVKLAGVPEGMVYAELAPGARAFTPVRSLNGRPSEGFSLAADGRGDVAATWLSGKLFANFSRDGGRTFTPDAEINPAYDPCDCCTTRAVYGADGSLAVLYREETDNQRDMYVIVLTRDKREYRHRVSSTLWKINGCPMTYYSLSPAPGGYVAAWPTKGQIYFARLDSRGNVLPPGEIKTPGHTGMRTGILALSAPDGSSLVAWKEQGQLRWQRYGREGQPEGAPGAVESAGKGIAGVVGKDGGFLLFQ